MCADKGIFFSVVYIMASCWQQNLLCCLSDFLFFKCDIICLKGKEEEEYGIMHD